MKTPKANIIIEDAQALHEKSPNTFDVPSESELEDLRVGDFIKVGFRPLRGTGERMWLNIERIENGELYAVLCNSPVVVKMEWGDEIVVHHRNVMDIEKAEIFAARIKAQEIETKNAATKSSSQVLH